MIMSELATTPNAFTPAIQPATIEQVATDATMSLEAWASELAHAYTIANTICNTMFTPQHFRGKPEEAAAAILYGFTLGMAPMVSLKTIYVVHGTPALYAQQMYAIALSKGHEIERVYADNERVEFRARRRGQSGWQKIEWTIERARQAKYTTNGKYQENPIGMLTEKCKAEAAKLVAPDALAGMNSIEEIELGDYAPAPFVQVEPTTVAETKKTSTRKVTRNRATAPAPVAPDVIHDAPEPEGEADESFDSDTGEAIDEGTPAVLEVNYFDEIIRLAGDKAGLRALYGQAAAAGEPQDVLDAIASAGTAA